jgi:solute carrier family 10 (sodium/bile acid cotransporter), member 7
MRNNALPWALSLAAALGLLWPEPGRAANAWALPFCGLGGWITVAIFLVSGWHLDLASLSRRAWGRISAAAVGVNLLLGPLLAWALLRALPGLPPDLALGFALMAAAPTTLNTGLSIAVAGGGNLSVAVLIISVVISASMLSLPLQLPWLAPEAAAAGLDRLQLFTQLLLQVLLPLGLGQLLRRRFTAPPRALWVATLGVAVSIWLAVSRQQGAWPSLAWGAWAALLFVALRGGMHWGALQVSQRLGLGAAGRRSFVITSSQKSVVLAGALLSQLPPGLDPWLGGAALFCVAYHLGQAFWDSAWAPKA